MIVIVDCSGLKTPESASAEFRAAAEAYVSSAIPRAVHFVVRIIECFLSEGGLALEDNYTPEPGEYRIDAYAYDEQGYLLLMGTIRYDYERRSFTRKAEDKWWTVLDPVRSKVAVPSDKWVEWFLHGERCPACGVFPDLTHEYLPCHLCDYAEYRDDDAESVRQRFLSDPDSQRVVSAVQKLSADLAAETDAIRRTYLKCRLSECFDAPRVAFRPLPWER